MSTTCCVPNSVSYPTVCTTCYVPRVVSCVVSYLTVRTTCCVPRGASYPTVHTTCCVPHVVYHYPMVRTTCAALSSHWPQRGPFPRFSFPDTPHGLWARCAIVPGPFIRSETSVVTATASSSARSDNKYLFIY